MIKNLNKASSTMVCNLHENIVIAENKNQER